MHKKGIDNFRISNNTFNYFQRRILQSTYNFFINKKYKEPFKIPNQPSQQFPPATTSQESPASPTNIQTNDPQSSTRSTFQENPFTFDERHSLLSELLEPVVRHSPLNEPQYEPII